ncbi:MAG: class I SAM-dependent methyltransferase [Eubacteriales bacterium]|nr:class I SAM-dependent methyltransferase [Eubacteriales bacterium]
MFTWTEQKLEWMCRAATYSGFYHRLAAIINDRIGQNKNVLDMGCGMGFLSRELAMLGHCVKGYDCDAKAIELAKSNSMGSEGKINIDNQQADIDKSCGSVKFSCATLENVYQRKELCDTLIACQFGAGARDYDRLFGIEANQYILIKNGRKSKTTTGKHRDTIRELCRYLQERQLSYELRRFGLHFDQPLFRKEVTEYCMAYGIEEKMLRYRVQTDEAVVIAKPKELYLIDVRGEQR